MIDRCCLKNVMVLGLRLPFSYWNTEKQKKSLLESDVTPEVQHLPACPVTMEVACTDLPWSNKSSGGLRGHPNCWFHSQSSGQWSQTVILAVLLGFGPEGPLRFFLKCTMRAHVFQSTGLLPQMPSTAAGTHSTPHPSPATSQDAR